MLDRSHAPTSIAWALFVAIGALAPAVRADDGVDHALEMRRTTSVGLGNSLDALTLSGFDPGDPRTGLTLIAAYGPTPLLFVESLAGDDLNNRPFTIAEIIASAIGSAASAWGLFDALGREGDANVAIGSLATAHALSWNLELMSNALSRLLFTDAAARSHERPAFIVFPVDGGAGITLRWQD
jgi:hypothetical protein